MKVNNQRKCVVRRAVLSATLVAIVVSAVVLSNKPAKAEIPVEKTVNVVVEIPQDTKVEITTKKEAPLSRGGEAIPHVHSKDEILLARLIESEAVGESYAGKLAVGTVVANRAINSNTKLFGGPTIEGVVLKAGHFDGVETTRFEDEPSEDCIKAAHEVLVGKYRTFGPEVVYYYNPKTATDRAFVNSVKPVKTIGNHTFAINK